MQANNVKKTLRTLTDVPSMPTVVAQALNIIKNPDSNVRELAEIISKDISITTQILKLVNSSYYGFPKQISTINRAIALIGMNKIKSLVLSVAIKPMLMSQSGKDMWEHSIRCAVASEIIAKSLGGADPDEAFTTGLLHDIGKAILVLSDKQLAEETNKFVKLGADRIIVEKKLFGIDHTEIGAELIERWSLPMVVRNCVEYHHAPLGSQFRQAAGIVYVADRITQEPIKYPILDNDILNALDIEIEDPIELREEVYRQSEFIIKALSSL